MITVVVEQTPKGRARTILDWVLRSVEHRLVVFSDDLPPHNDAILAMQGYPLYGNGAVEQPFQRLTGSMVPIGKARGYRFESFYGPVIPTFSAELISAGKMNLMPVLMWDIDRALNERGRGAPIYPMGQLTLFPTPSDFEQWCRDAATSEFIVHDIETPFSRRADEDEDEQDPSFTINRFSLGRQDGHAITASYQEPFISVLKDFLGRSGADRVGFNSDEFDDPREAANGWPMGGKRVDVRWLWHSLQPTLPSSLAFVSTLYTRVTEWKSIGSTAGTDDELYSAMDAWATVQDYLGVVKALKGRKLR